MKRPLLSLAVVVALLLGAYTAFGGSTWTLPCTGDIVNCTAGTYNLGTLTLTTPMVATSGGTGSSNTATSTRYLKGDGTNFVTSSGAASGTGACTNQFARTLNSDAAPTCATVVLGTDTSGAAPTASALAADPTDCAANNFATTIAANGDLTCAQPSISAGVSGLGTGVATFLGTPSSANLASALTTKTGTGVAVFDTSPTFTTGITNPLVSGGTATGSTLTLNGTSNGAPSAANVILLSARGGMVGIGTTTPDLLALGSSYTTLTVSSNNTAAVINTHRATTTTSSDIGVYDYWNGSTRVAEMDVGADGATDAGVYSFWTATGGALTQRMTIKSTGNVGIGTTSPTALLSVGTGSAFQVLNGGNSGQGIAAVTNIGQRVSIALSGSTTETGTNLRPTFDSSATTEGTAFEIFNAVANASFTMTDLYGLKIDNSWTRGASASITNATGVYIGNPNITTTNTYGIYINGPSGGATSNYSIYSTGGVNYFSGNVGIANTSPGQKLDVTGTIRQSNAVSCALTTNASGDIGCVSDERAKNVLGTYSGSLDALAAIQPIRYMYKGEDYTHVGFSAQNVQMAISEAVPIQKNNSLGLDTVALAALTVNAVNELNQRTAKVNSRFDDMEIRLAALESNAGLPPPKPTMIIEPTATPVPTARTLPTIIPDAVLAAAVVEKTPGEVIP